METFNYSGFGFGEFLNSSNINSEPTSVEESFKWTNAEIARLIHIIFRPILIIVGTVGNGLTIYIMRRTSTKTFIKLFLHGCFGSGRYKQVDLTVSFLKVCIPVNIV